MTVSSERKVGLFFLITLVALGVLIELVEDWNPFEKKVSYHAVFRSAIGLKEGDPVRMAGVDIGKVRQITLAGNRAQVEFYVVEGTRLSQGSVAQIRRTNLLGGQFLGIDPGPEEAPLLAEGAELRGEEAANIDELITSFNRNQDRVMGEITRLVQDLHDPLLQTVTQLESVMRKVDQGEGTLGLLVNDAKAYEELTAAVGDLRIILGRLEKGEGSLGLLLRDPALYNEAQMTFANLREITGRISSGEGTLGRLVNDDALYGNVNETFAQLREIAKKTNEGEGTLGRLVNDEALYNEFHATMVRINSIAAKLDQGNGTLGRLINEDDLYRDAKTTLHKIEKTADGMSDSGPISALGVVLGTLF